MGPQVWEGTTNVHRACAAGVIGAGIVRSVSVSRHKESIWKGGVELREGRGADSEEMETLVRERDYFLFNGYQSAVWCM